MKIQRIESTTAWAEAIAALWCERLTQTPRLRMCLPAGHTPVLTYHEMARAVAARRVSFRNTEIFALDEYGTLAADDPGRCANMLRRELIDHIDLPQQHFHYPDTLAADLDRVSRDYDVQLARGGGLDMTLLGIGMNGHLGMNEPGSDATSTTRRVELHASTIDSSRRYLTHANAPTWGISVGLEQLLESKEVWLLATGVEKAEIVARALNGPVGNDVPATLLRHHPNCLVFVDKGAAALL